MDRSEPPKQFAKRSSSKKPPHNQGVGASASNMSSSHDPSANNSQMRSQDAHGRTGKGARGTSNASAASSSAHLVVSVAPLNSLSNNNPEIVAKPVSAAHAVNGERADPQPSSDSVPRSASQKRKERRKKALLKQQQQQQDASPSGSEASGSSTTIATAPQPATSRASGGGSHGNARQSATGAGAGESKRIRRFDDPMQIMKEEMAAATAPRKLQNLSGFGAHSSYESRKSHSAAASMEESAAEYVPSSQRKQSETDRHTRAHGPRVRSNEPALDVNRAIEGQTEMAATIIKDLVANRYECDICFVVIRRSVATWTCNHCHSIFHIVCAKKWAKSAKAPNAPPDAPIGRWHCPKCRHGHDGVPNSWCFCGKVKNPQNEPMRVPHSCGDPCLRPRSGTTCPHLCPLQCHPGPCPPCTSMGPLKHCWCGRASYRLRCGQEDDGQSCESQCGRKLQCGRHACSQQCHPGKCEPCAVQLEQKCYCGKTTATRTCGASDEKEDTSTGESRFFSCHTTCDRLLDCGNHHCKKICHTGPCEPCTLQPKFVKTCGCGAKPLLQLTNGMERTSCLDPIPSCEAICNKTRECGHSCKDVCHPGPCAPCEVPVEVPCRCHTMNKTLPCREVYPNLATLTNEFLCDRLCGRQMSCGKHQCNLRCCPSMFDPRDFDGHHVCRVTCNKRLKCGKHLCKQTCHKGRCGRCLEAVFNDIVCPCGKTIQEAPILCGTPPLVCPHPCSKVRPCGHDARTHNCHEGDCPPCVIPVHTDCAGGHTVMVNIPCFKGRMSCGMPCNKPMACGLHNCKQLCHEGSCEPPLPDDVDPKSVPARRSCGQRCKARLYSCEHLCPAMCHPGEPCPDVPCTQMSQASCECGVTTAEVPCSGKEKKVLACTAACASAKRQRMLAEAFSIYGTSTTAPRYPEMLLNMACVAPLFISRLEKWFEAFLKTPATVTRKELPIMDRIQRQCVHELAKFYGIGTESAGSDEKKQRAVTLLKRNFSKPPSVPLTTVAGVTGLTSPSSFSSEDGADGTHRSHLLETAQSSTLHIYDLHKGISTSHLHSFLQGFTNEYTLQWIDDENCLAIFTDPARMQRALNTLQPRGVFKVKQYQDVNPEPISSGMVSIGSTSTAWNSDAVPTAVFSSAAPQTMPSSSSSAARVKTTSESGYKPQSVWGTAPQINSGTANRFAVLDASPSTSSSSNSSKSQTVSSTGLMMWNMGEAGSSDSTRYTSRAPAPLESESPRSNSPPRSVAPVVQDWNDLVKDDDVEPTAP